MDELTWFGYVLIGLQVLAALVTVARVGKPREPIDGVTAAITVVISGLIIWGSSTIGTVS